MSPSLPHYFTQSHYALFLSSSFTLYANNMSSPIRIFPNPPDIVDDTQLYKTFIKHTITTSDNNLFEIHIPFFATVIWNDFYVFL